MESTYEHEQGPRYAAELDAAAELLQTIHPIGAVKAIGRLEVAAALKEIVRRWNTFDQMRDALAELVDGINNPDNMSGAAVDRAEAALAAAQEEPTGD